MSEPDVRDRADDELFELVLEMFDGWEVIPESKVEPLTLDLARQYREAEEKGGD